MEISLYKHGSDINIKKSHQGQFTEYCGGEVTNEKIQKAKQSNDPKIRKQAVFAENARKWKHAYGGSINGNSANPEGQKQLPKDKKDLPSEKDKQLPKEKKLPTAQEKEYVKQMLKKYPGLTELQAAGRAPIKIKGRNYVLKDGRMRRLQQGGSISKIFNFLGTQQGQNYLDAGKKIFNSSQNTNQYGLVNKTIDSLQDSTIMDSVARRIQNSDNAELQSVNNYKFNPLNMTGVNMINYDQPQLFGLMINQDRQYSQMYQNYLKDQRKQQSSHNSNTPELWKQNAQTEADKIKQEQEESNYSRVADASKENKSNGSPLTSQNNTLNDLNNGKLKGIILPNGWSLPSNKKGGSLKPFGNYEDPTDDCGVVNPKTKKLVKRSKSYHRYNVGSKV